MLTNREDRFANYRAAQQNRTGGQTNTYGVMQGNTANQDNKSDSGKPKAYESYMPARFKMNNFYNSGQSNAMWNSPQSNNFPRPTRSRTSGQPGQSNYGFGGETQNQYGSQKANSNKGILAGAPQSVFNTPQQNYAPQAYKSPRPTRSRIGNPPPQFRPVGGNLNTSLMRQPDNTFQGDINDYR